MKERYYLIKEAAAKVGVETHVLRYWEEELKMDILRNEMGHRYYTQKDIDVLQKVKALKEKGLQLKAIRSYLDKRREEIAGQDKQTTLVPVQSNVLSNEEKMAQFQNLMNRIVSHAILENKELIGQNVGEHAAQTVVTQISGMTKEQEAREEARYQKLDQTLREIQKARMEAAAANMRPVDKRRQKRLKRKGGKNSGVQEGLKEERTDMEPETEHTPEMENHPA